MMRKKLFKIEASELVYYSVLVSANSEEEATDEAVKILADTELRQDHIVDYNGFQTEKIEEVNYV